MASSTVNGAHNDGQNQQYSILGVIGTLGTADVQGTALTLPVAVNPTTGALYVQDLSGASGTTNVQGSVQVTGGSIVVTAGTIGSIPNIGQVHNAGTIQNGTLAQVTTVSNITNGTIRVTAGSFVGTINSGTIDAVTTVANLTNGSIRVTAGTITSGSIVVTAGTIGDATVKIGTINSGTINAGTINSGTINAGTITVGTLNIRTSKTMQWFGTTTTGTIGTLITAPTGGSAIHITSLDVSNYVGTMEQCVSFGLVSGGNGVVFRGQLGAQGGIAKSFLPPNTGGTTNAALTWNTLTGSGTVSINVGYFTEI